MARIIQKTIRKKCTERNIVKRVKLTKIMSHNNGGNGPTNKAPWPVRKGIFRSSGQSDYVPQRTPSPIVEMPNTPVHQQSPSNPISPLSPRCITFVERSMSPPAPAATVSPLFHQPFVSAAQTASVGGTKPTKSKLKLRNMLTPINVSMREIPIEVQQEVRRVLQLA